ncbi:MAG: hypothetical protein QW815_05380 [Nitrososphaerota archaeon]
MLYDDRHLFSCEACRLNHIVSSATKEEEAYLRLLEDYDEGKVSDFGLQDDLRER